MAMTCPDMDEQAGIVQRIAWYVDASRGVRAPESSREAAFRCLSDLVAAVAAGVLEPAVCAVRRMAVSAMGAGNIPIWFSGLTSSVIGAAWANSAAAAALDLDDGHRLARGHPGAAVIPAAFAVASETGASLEEMISAIIIGYEVGVTVGAARVNYGNTGTWSAYAVVATAAALRRTSAPILAHALAIAGESSPNQLFSSASAPRIPAPEGSAVKEGIPWSVVTGLIALGLAEAGHTGPRNILDSRSHYCFSDPLALGDAQHIRRTYFKLYACCRHVHAPLDALLEVVCRHNIHAVDITAIKVETTSGAMRISNRAQPDNLIDVQYSIPYCLALAVLRGPSALLPLTEAALGHEDVSGMAKKVMLTLNPEFDAVFPAKTLARVSVFCGDQCFASNVTEPRGEASSPLSWAELEAKFIQASRMNATPEQQACVLEAMNHLRAGKPDSLLSCFERLRLNATFRD